MRRRGPERDPPGLGGGGAPRDPRPRPGPRRPCPPAGAALPPPRATKRRRPPDLPTRHRFTAPDRDLDASDAAAASGPLRTNFPASPRPALLTSAPSTASGPPWPAAPGPRAPGDRAPVVAAAAGPAGTGAPRAAARTAVAPSSRALAPPLRRADPSGTFATLLAFHGRHVTAAASRSAADPPGARPAPPAASWSRRHLRPGPLSPAGSTLPPWHSLQVVHCP